MGIRKAAWVFDVISPFAYLGFRQLPRVPVNVVFLLDASGSVIGELGSLRDAATEFIRRLGPEDKVSIIEFHSKIELIQDWTSNQDDLVHAISWRFRPGPIPQVIGKWTTFAPASKVLAARL